MLTKKKIPKPLGIVFCLVFLNFLLIGCGNNIPTEKGDPNILKVGVINFADTLEPTQNYFGWVVMRYGLGECLTRFDQRMNLQPWLAENWSVSDDHLTWIFKIRDEIKFSNGVPLTAEAAKKSLERTFQKNSRAKTFFEYESITAENQNLIIKTFEPISGIPGFLADPLFVIVDVTAENSRNFSRDGVICTGPYTVESFNKERAVMKRNKLYWDGTVSYPTVEIISIDDPTTRSMALQSGDIDIAVNIAAGDIEVFRNNENFHVDEIASLRVVLARLNQNPDHILSDPKVRSALIGGCDRKSYNDILLRGTFISGKAPIPPSLDYGFNELQDPNIYNPERAIELLNESGWIDLDGDGIREKDGKKLHLNFVVYNSRAELPIYAEAVQSDLKKIGFDINIDTVDYNLIDNIGLSGEYDLLISSITTANTGDPEVFLKWYWKTNLNGNNPQNSSGYSNSLYDEKLNQLSTEFDSYKRRQLIIELQQILLNDGASIFFGYPQTNIVNANYVDGVIMYPTDYYWITKSIRPLK